MTPATYTTREVIRREPGRTLWRIVTRTAGAIVAEREEWRPPAEEDEPTGGANAQRL